MIDFLYRKNRKTRKNHISIISITQTPPKTFFFTFDIENELYRHVHSFSWKLFSKNSKLSRVFSLRRYHFLSSKKSLELLNTLSLAQLFSWGNIFSLLASNRSISFFQGTLRWARFAQSSVIPKKSKNFANFYLDCLLLWILLHKYMT